MGVRYRAHPYGRGSWFDAPSPTKMVFPTTQHELSAYHLWVPGLEAKMRLTGLH